MKLGFIGCGKMATALAQGTLKAGVCAPGDLTLSDAVPAAAEALARSTGGRAVASNAEVAQASDAVVLAVKPGDAIGALQSAAKSGGAQEKQRLLLSIVAGLPLSKFEAAAGSNFRVIRVMPNTPALLLRGASAFARGANVTDEDAEIATRVFGSVGLAVEVKETLLDAVTGLSGSGPAYVYTIIEALADGGVLMGLPRDLSLRLAAQTVAGSAEMVLQSGQHPGALRDQVTSPGGTTIAGLEALERGGLRAAILAAVRAATERAHELGAAK